jgi:drug/metabolite transporter (DMT)-like permease
MEWLRELLILPTTSSTLRTAIICTLAAFLYALFPSERSISRRGIASALGLFAVPLLLQQAAHLSGYTSAALWALAPVLIVVVCGARSTGLRQEMLVTALAGVAGTLLILPFQFPASAADGLHWLILLAGIASAAIASVTGPGAAGFRTTGLLSAAIVLWIATIPRGPISLSLPELLWIGCIDLPGMLLLLWLLQRMPPEALSTRYLLPMAITILTSWVALHQQMTIRFAGGVVLLLASSAGLIFLSRRAA